MRSLLFFLPLALLAQPRIIKFDSLDGVTRIGLDIEKASFKGKAGLRVVHRSGEDGRSLAILPGVDFTNGTIEYEFAGAVKPNSGPAVRGFTGIASRVSPDGASYECFYQRVLNARSDDQEQRNHSVQYILMPDLPWRKLRAEAPSRYETYADMQVGEWTSVKIVVKGDKAATHINGAQQPTMLVNDLKHGVSRGTLARWDDVGTIAYFANLRISP